MPEDEKIPTFTPTKASGRTPTKDRPPAPAQPARATADDVKRALGTMRGIYGAAAAFLMVRKLPNSAEVIADNLDELEAANRAAFEASPQLAKLIAGAAPVAAVSTFFVAHATVGFSVFSAIREETREKREAREAQEMNDGTSAPDMG